MSVRLIAAFALLAFAAPAFAAETLMMDDFNSDTMASFAIKQTAPASVTAALEKSPQSGQYLSLDFNRPADAAGMLGTWVQIPAVAKAIGRDGRNFDGITMKVRGDGSSTYGLVEIICDGYSNRFQAVFPLASKDWTEVSIRWDDFFRTNMGSKNETINFDDLTSFGFGSREHFGSAKYAVDDIALAKIPPRAPIAARPGMDRLASFAAKISKKEPVTIVALGDSITFGTQVPVAERQSALYFQVFARELEKAFPGVKATPVNRGVGGESIGRALVRIGHEVVPAKPDLVIVELGANDALDNESLDRVRSQMNKIVDHLIAETDADVVIMGPTPVPIEIKNWPDGYIKVYSEIAKERGVVFADLSGIYPFAASHKTEFFAHSGGDVHPTVLGHENIGEALTADLMPMLKGGSQKAEAKKAGEK